MTVANKVVYNGNMLIDLTEDTATADDVMVGKTFHLANGARGTGTLKNAKLGTGYGTCNSWTASDGCVVTLADYERVTGGIISVQFSLSDGVPAGAYLNVNGQGRAKIKHEGADIKADVIGAGDTAVFMYDGTYYRLLSVDACVISDTELTALETKLGL